jgi:NTE family protein
VLLVLLSPLEYPTAPRSADEIKHRAMELSFTTSFLSEMRMLVEASQYARSSLWPMGGWERRLTNTRFHLIDTNDLEAMERAETKLITNAPFLETLRDLGRQRAQDWLERNFETVGRSSTVDLKELFA